MQPRNPTGKRNRDQQIKVTKERFARAMAYLYKSGDRGMTCKELAEAADLSVYTVGPLIKVLMKYRVAYISRWALDTLGRINTPAYAIGDKEDVVRVPLSRAEIHARYKARQKARRSQTSDRKKSQAGNEAMKLLF